MRGGSTEIVGTTSAVAPCPDSFAVTPPACSLVRGTRTRQPNSGFVSYQLPCSRSATTSPTTAVVGEPSMAVARGSSSPSVVVVVDWVVVVPWEVTATGVEAARPAASRPTAAAAMSSPVPRTTTVASWSAWRDQSRDRPAGCTTLTLEVRLVVIGTPA